MKPCLGCNRPRSIVTDLGIITMPPGTVAIDLPGAGAPPDGQMYNCHGCHGTGVVPEDGKNQNTGG